MHILKEETLLTEALFAIILLMTNTECAQTNSATNPAVNIANLNKLASLSPEQVQKTFRYLENPYIATSLVERDRAVKESLVYGTIPRVFDEPLENTDLQNHILRRRPLTLEEAVKDPILGPYFGSQIEEDDRNVKLNIRT